MTLASDLRAAKALIDTPEKWAKGASWAPPSQGLCTLGAVEAIAHGDRREAMYQAIVKAIPRRYTHFVSRFNDAPKTRHADIMALFDRAITLAESSQ